MKDILGEIDRWRQKAEQVALATVVETWGSAPRREGATMALTGSGLIAGSVSGGCVEGAVLTSGLEVLESGKPELLMFGVADEIAWGVGLACGGSLEVFVEPLDTAHYEYLRALILDERPAASVTVIRGPQMLLGRKLSFGMDPAEEPLGSLSPGLDEAAVGAARRALADGVSRRVLLDADPADRQRLESFVQVFQPSPQLIIVGGVHIAIAMVAFAKTLGYRTIVVDPRRAFGSQARFPDIDQLIQAWPEEAFARLELNASTAVVMLTHDPKIDDPALRLALPSRAFYVGALGSRSTQAKRRERLRQAGLKEAVIDRLHGPIGLDLGGQSPEEIALAVMAQVVAARSGQAAGEARPVPSRAED